MNMFIMMITNTNKKKDMVKGTDTDTDRDRDKNVDTDSDMERDPNKEYEILRSPGRGASLSKTGQVYHYCAMRSICLLNRAISPTFLPLCPRHSTFHQMYFPPSSPQDTVDSTRSIFLMGV
jgi:hypothetical protein